MTKKKLTVYELLKLKGKKQIHEVYVNSVEEAAAAEAHVFRLWKVGQQRHWRRLRFRQLWRRHRRRG